MNDVIVRVSAMKTTPIRPPRLSPCDEAFKQEVGQADLEQAQQAEPEQPRTAPATTRLSQGLFARVCNDEAEKKNEKRTPTAVKTPMIDRQ